MIYQLVFITITSEKKEATNIMKFKRSLSVLIASSVLLVACNNDDEQIKSYNDGLDKIQKAEQPIQAVNQSMNKLEKEKEKLTKEISGKDINSVQDQVQKVLKNTNERDKELKKEVNAMDKSEQEFKRIKNDVSEIEDKEKKKQFEEFNQAMEKKYQTHSDLVKGYQNVINKEKNLFSYFTGQSGTQEEIDTRSKSLVDAQKQMKSKVDNYTNSIKKVQKEKSDIDQYFK